MLIHSSSPLYFTVTFTKYQLSIMGNKETKDDLFKDYPEYNIKIIIELSHNIWTIKFLKQKLHKIA